MNASRQTELINAALDGELDSASRSELDALLGASDSARAEFEQMQGLLAYLDKCPDAEPPPELRKQILEAIKLPTPQRKWFGLFDTWTNFGRVMPRAAQLGVAAAAGALITAGAYNLSGSFPDGMSERTLVGTMAKTDQKVSSRTGRSVTIDSGVVSGTARLEVVGGTWAVGFDLQADDPIVIAVRSDGPGYPPLKLTVAGPTRIWTAVSADTKQVPSGVSFDITKDGVVIFSAGFEAAQQ